jgi:hypothetical protein
LSEASAGKSDEEGKGGDGGGDDDDDYLHRHRRHHKLHEEPNGSFSRIRSSTCRKQLLQMEFLICVNSPAYWQKKTARTGWRYECICENQQYVN